jgi:hypothetical protein
MEKKFKICLACTSTPVEGCESMTEAEVFDFLSIHNEKLDEPNECGDTSKYVTLDVDFDPSALAND